jgi:hypothetical protein
MTSRKTLIFVNVTVRTSKLATVLEGQKVEDRLPLRKFGSMNPAIQIPLPKACQRLNDKKNLLK